MTWRYMAAEDDFGWSVREVYNGRPWTAGGVGWTADDIGPHGDSREELVRDIKMMLADVEQGDTLDLMTEKIIEAQDDGLCHDDPCSVCDEQA